MKSAEFLPLTTLPAIGVSNTSTETPTISMTPHHSNEAQVEIWHLLINYLRDYSQERSRHSQYEQ